MGNYPLVSIILPTYNRANFLKRSIESALSQTFQDFELIIIDDGSTDSTYEILQNFGDSRIDFLTTEHKGVSAARNLGLLEASGEFVTFLDSDDQFFPQKIELQLQKFYKNQRIGLVACGTREVTIQGHILIEARPWLNVPNLDLESWLFGCPAGTNVMMVKKELIDSIGGFDTNLIAHEDWDLGLRLSYYGCEMTWCHEVLVEASIHDNNIHLDPAKSIFSQKLILEKFYSQSGLTDQAKELMNLAYSKMYLRNALTNYKDSNYSEAGQILGKVVENDPSLLSNDYFHLLEIIADWSNLITFTDRSDFIRTAFYYLPENLAGMKKYKRKTIGMAEVSSLFKSKRKGDLSKSKLPFLRAIFYDPSWLSNNGFLSLGLEVILGKEYSNKIKTIIKNNTSVQ
jgi:glycosyltransferase involved in cell wall biosynthesis